MIDCDGRKERMMRRNRITRALKVAALIVLGVAVLGVVVMSLWNWLLPPLFALRPITFWQALGLLVLTKILFGGFRGMGHYGGYWRGRMAERWERMTPEEREQFRAGMRRRCGGMGQPPESNPVL
jgi:hypothetical protein